jgi:glycogen debranching enzyme
MIDQAGRDIFLLRQPTPKGPCLSAGLPWYAVAFGRDQAVTGMQIVSFAPGLSKQILKVLAAYQGTKNDKFTEEAPGRILHELRLGEMARCREIPFIPFYGTIDATPLWLLLLNRYVDTTGDIALARELWPNVERALDYLEKSTSDTTGGFLFYGGQGKSALSNQCWKDSGDSIMYKNGVLAKQPIATCEVQGYLFEAFSATARLAKALGHDEVSARLEGKAAALKVNFQKYFWLPQQKFVALALDGDAKPCSVISSNPGHLLNSGILERDMQDAVVSRLMQNDMYSGWGIRTLSSEEVKYNPMSYHDGTVWPHDNAMTIEGMAATGHPKEACTVMSSLIDAAATASDSRLPELFCGFPRTQFDGPVPYPVSCVPQAWAAGSIFEMLKATLGIYPHQDQIVVKNPALPHGVNKLTVDNLKCGDKSVNLSFVRSGATERVNVSFTDGAPVKVEQTQ